MATLQLQLNLAPATHKPLNLVGMVYSIMLEREWVTPAEIQKEIFRRTGEFHSDSSITARIRDARKDCYGGHVIEKRQRENSKAYEYKLVR